MKRFFTKIARFFWSWGFLKFVLFLITLIILLYVEEDWRGARAWVAMKTKWEAKGESFDLYGKFTPPPVPDAENLTSIPLFKLELLPTDSSTLEPVALQKAMREGQSSNVISNLTPPNRWQAGELAGPDKMHEAVAAAYAEAFHGQSLPPSPLDQFQSLFPFMEEVRTEAATRTSFRLPLLYDTSPPANRSLGAIVELLKLSKFLTFHALLALDQRRSDLALGDFRANSVIAAGVGRDPSLVGALVKIGMFAVNENAVYVGLARHQWSDANLIELEHELSRVNFLADGQFAFRCEAAVSIANIDYFKHARPLDVYRMVTGLDDDTARYTSLVPRWPAGWWDMNKCQMADSMLNELAVVDPQKRRAFPNISLDLQNQLDRAKLRWLAWAPWNIWAMVALGPVDNSMQKFPEAQVWLDETRIACALERYHLARGVYPDSLDNLSPAFIAELPHDLINGEPYHYHLRPDGTFLLYSVGWNQTDDGGKIAHLMNAPKMIDYDNGDWVWPTPQKAP